MRKFIVVIVCIVTLTIALGLPNRLTKEGIKTALSYPNASVYEVQQDIAILQVAGFVFDQYSSSQDGMFVFNLHYDDDGVYQWLTVSTKTEWGGYVHETFTKEEVPLAIARKAVNLFEPITFDWFSGDEGVLNAVDAIAHFFALLFVCIEFVLLIVFDSFFAAFGLVRGALYLLGF